MDGMYDFLPTHPASYLTVDWVAASIWTPIVLLGTYFVLTFIVVPFIAKDREPMEMTYFLYYYNALILLSNLTLLIYFMYYQVTGKFSPICQPVGGDDETLNLRLAQGFYAYFGSKIFELADSMIILLRHKTSQKTCLHFYHHSSMLFLVWLGLRYFPGGSSVILASINTFFHVIIYLYFHAVTLHWVSGARMSSFKTVTTVSQIVQFSLAILHCITASIKNCGYPRSVLIIMIIYISSFVLLHFGRDWASRLMSCHLRRYTDDLPPGVQATLSSVQALQRRVEDVRQAGPSISMQSTFLPRPASMPSDTNTVILKELNKLNDVTQKQISIDKVGDLDENVEKSENLSFQRNTFGITATQNQNLIINDNKRLSTTEKDIVSTAMDEFGNFLSRRSKQTDNLVDRLVHISMKIKKF